MTALKVDIHRKVFNANGANRAHLVIEDLSFEARAGEFVCILGPSGCGKSTLLNLISELDKDYEGRISFPSGVAANLAYVFQSPRLLPWRTVAENIALVLTANAETKNKTEELIAEVGLADFANAYPGQLSLGMQRRAALARAYATKPNLLLMDEPFVSLDEQAADRLRTLLTKMWQSRPTTILFVTHDVREAIGLADRLIELSVSPCRVVRQINVDLSCEQRRDLRYIEEFRIQNMPTISSKEASQ